MQTPQFLWPACAGLLFLALALAALWRELPATRGLARFALFGRLCFAIPLAVFGAEHFASASDIMRLVPSWIPAHLFWTYFVGIALLAAALSIVLNIRLRLSAPLLGAMFLLFVLLMDIPGVFQAPANRLTWTLAARELSFSLAAFLLAAPPRLVRPLRSALAAIAVFYGIEHFLHPECVPGVPLEKLTPAFIPAPLAWTYLTGAALVVGGLAMLLNFKPRPSAAALGSLVLFLVLFFYLPILFAAPNLESLNYVFDTLLYAGALLIAAAP